MASNAETNARKNSVGSGRNYATLNQSAAGGDDRLLALLRGAAPSPAAAEPESEPESEPLPEPAALTKRQAAGLLSVSERTLDRLVVRGDIPHIRLGRRCVRFPRAGLMRWIESKTKYRRA